MSQEIFDFTIVDENLTKKPTPATPPASEYSQELVDSYNKTVMYGTTLERENSSLQRQTDDDRSSVVTRLARYGIAEIPSEIETRLARLKQARKYLFIADVRSHQLNPSPMVTGWSNRHKYAKIDKANRVMEKAFIMLENAKTSLAQALDRLSPNAPISSDDENAIDKLRAKVAIAEQAQAKMKAANKIVDSKKLSVLEKIEQLKALGEDGKGLMKGDFCGRLGYPSYMLQNNNANIRRMKERIAELEKAKTDLEKEWTDEVSGVRIVDSPTENRLMIFFPGKPDRTTIEQLKSRGFRWSPTSGAWQRFRGGNAEWAAQQITGIKIMA